MDHLTDQLYMRHAFELALRGQGYVSPNPMVGCVIVHAGVIIGEGWHQQYGEAHAEVNAVRSVADKSLLKEATVYVSLEPCNHHGKTPPCTDLLLEHGVKRVVIANVDPNPVAVGGAERLRKAGISVTTGVLEAEGRELNRRFFKWIEKKQPYIILKWAQTADGFVAKENFDSKWISNELSRQRSHQWRTQEDAVLVGRRTAFHDNPQLNVREWTGRNPTRIVIDRYLTLSDKLHLFDRTQPTVVFNVIKHEEHPNLKLLRLNEEQFLNELVRSLVEQNIQSVIIEGGAHTLIQFIEANYWDEARVFVAPKQFHKGIQAPPAPGSLHHVEAIDGDQLFFYRNI